MPVHILFISYRAFSALTVYTASFTKVMPHLKTPVSTNAAPSPRAGIYNQAIIANGMVYTSGFTPVDPCSGNLVEGSVGDRTVR